MLFYAMYSYYPEFTWDVKGDVPEGEALATHCWVAEIMAEQKRLVDWLKKAIEYQAKYYNRQYTLKHYKVGAKVLLSLKNIQLFQLSRKLNYYFFKPFEIIEVVDKQAYYLQLPKILRAVHLVFYISLLELYYYKDSKEPLAPPLAILKESGEEYKVNKVLDKC